MAARVGAAAALAVVAAPLAALLPLVDTGSAKNADCGALQAQARNDVAKPAQAPPSPQRRRGR